MVSSCKGLCKMEDKPGFTGIHSDLLENPVVTPGGLTACKVKCLANPACKGTTALPIFTVNFCLYFKTKTTVPLPGSKTSLKVCTTDPTTKAPTTTTTKAPTTTTTKKTTTTTTTGPAGSGSDSSESSESGSRSKRSASEESEESASASAESKRSASA